MSQALDAAIRAGCSVGRRTDDPCRWPSCGCAEDRDAVIAALRAALPVDPPAGLIVSHGALGVAIYLELRAHLLGDDA